MKFKINNKTQKLITYFFIVFLLFIVAGISVFNINTEDVSNNATNSEKIITQVDEIDKKELKLSGYWNFQSIHIDNANGYGNGTWDDVDDNDWCQGSGTFQDPYRLENITIDAKGYGHGITINQSEDVYFIIKNCTVINSGNQPEDAGIFITVSNNGTIIDNEVKDCEIG
ncbi:MAG: hypothetical protein GF383_06075, partial [Candidatus Lokiarchaeota archaeon]|nr:hypothetical protein [Candidatus Lokiarchaeota archaeon]MBD3339513.1 hypothetical protein [Candidatus Lokiarchaeota archaeon]